MAQGPARPGFHPGRLHRLMVDALAETQLRLDRRTVITEAASGAYVVTPVLAALAGARVQAFTRTTRYGTFEEVAAATRVLAERARVLDRIEIVGDRAQLRIEEADVITNSGHLRPLDAALIERLRPGAALPLMFESWEFRAGDVDLDACRRRGVLVAGTNERHPAVDVFSFLGAMALKLLFDAGIAAHRSRIVLLCDNPFAPYIARTLEQVAGQLAVLPKPDVVPFSPDAILVAMKPSTALTPMSALTHRIADAYPSAAIVQYWGDLDRRVLAARGAPVWPPEPPSPGHMAVLPSDIGPEAIVRLQNGGLKVAEVLLKPARERGADDLAFVQLLE